MPSIKKGKRPLVYYWIIAIVAFLVIQQVLQPIRAEGKPKEITYSQFVSMIDNGQVREVTKDDYNYTFTAVVDGDKQNFITGLWPDTDLTERLLEASKKHKNLTFTKDVETKMSPWLTLFVTSILPLLFLLLIFYMANRSLSKTMGGRGGGDFMNFGKSNAKIYMENKTGKTFADVAGQEEAKDSLNEVVDFLHGPQKYKEIGAVLPKGVLLVGPPGTGKTLLAKAVAGEADVPFFSVNGSSFIEMFVGVGASRVRDLFETAKKEAPAIVFIDEIDAIGKSRAAGGFGGGNDEREQTLNQLLAEMDGFSSDANPVIVLAATNRPEVLDAALLRPGRFDRQVLVDKPDFKGRIEILNVHSKDIKLSKSVDLEEIARLTAGLAGADLANIINEAALLAGRNEKNYVEQNDLVEAVERAIAGLEKKSRRINPKEKRIVAYHECGHALISETTKGADKVTKVSIIPRGLAALGYTLNTPEENKFLMQKHELYAMIDVLLGGRAAEEIFIKEISTGASNDLERATDIVKSMVSMYGMSDLDIAGLMVLEKQRNMFLNGGQALKDYSDDMAKKLDDYVKQTLDERYKSVLETLRTYAGAIEEMVKALYENETIEGEKVREIIKNFEIKNGLPSRLQQDDEKGEGDL